MKVVYHPAVQRDVNAILKHYDQISPNLGDSFWNELMQHIEAASQNPGRYHFHSPGVRRVNLKRFPYHFLFRELGNRIRVFVVRHHKRHPAHSLGRN